MIEVTIISGVSYISRAYISYKLVCKSIMVEGSGFTTGVHERYLNELAIIASILY